MSKEVDVGLSEDGGLVFSEDLSAEELASIIFKLSVTKCNDPDCLYGKSEKCELCRVGDEAYKIRLKLSGGL